MMGAATIVTRAAAALAVLVAACGGPGPGAAPDGPGPDGASPDGQAAAGDYLLFAPMSSTTTYLMDRDGQIVHTWASSSRPGLSVYLLDDGHLLRTESIPSTVFGAGGSAGRVTEYDWDGVVVWQHDYADSTHWSHHDVARLPNGHVLMIAWEAISDDDAIAAGRDPTTLPATGELWADHVVEIDPATDQIVWQWHAWDHTIQDRDPSASGYGVVADHPELIDLGYGARAQNDWLHVNAIDYDAALDEIALSAHNPGELWVIDHATTTAEAAGHQGGARGHGGDLLYRWGNPAAYGAGTAADQQLFAQHDVHWIPAGRPGTGDLLAFDNGVTGARPYSTVVEVAPPIAGDGSYGGAVGGYGPAAPAWTYTADPPDSMFAQNLSGAQRLPDGDTLICVGTEGRFVEVRPDGAVVWTFTYPPAMKNVFRVTSIPADAPALAGRDLTPLGPIAAAAAR
jgi:Arylsulfotransferase (ASST)